MNDRRQFLSKSTVALGASLLAPNSIAVASEASRDSTKDGFNTIEDYFPASTSSETVPQPDKFEKQSLTGYGEFAARVRAATPVDTVVGLSEVSINKFLQAHFTKNPGIYNRSRESGVSPIYQYDFDDHGKMRAFRFWAAVHKDQQSPALAINLSPPAERSNRLRAYWRSRSQNKTGNPATPIPPNVELTVPHIIVQIDFPKLEPVQAGGDPVHHLDLNYSVTVGAYVSLEQESDGSHSIKLTDWEIQLKPLDDPLWPPASAVWGPTAPSCNDQLTEARLELRDFITLGANIALSELCKTFTRSASLPSIDVVNGAALSPRELFIQDRHIAVSAVLTPSSAAFEAISEYKRTVQKLETELLSLNLEEIKSTNQALSAEQFHDFAIRNSPTYRAVIERRDDLLKQNIPTEKPKLQSPIPQNDFFVMLSGNFFNQLARTFLTADEHHCSDWYKLSLVIAYLQGRACYWFQLFGAHGGVTGTNISMGCGVNLGGNLDLQACVHVLCAPDQCATWSPGIGLAGPLDISVDLQNLSWNNNQALILRPHVSNFPGLQIYGFFDPITTDVVNYLLKIISGAALTAFFNAIFSVLAIPLIQVPTTVPMTNVSVNLNQFGAANIDQMLTVVGTTSFS